MKILLADFHKFVHYSGGIEHVLSDMADALCAKDCEVYAAFSDPEEGNPFFPMNRNIPVYNLYHLPWGPAVSPSAVLKLLREAVRPFSEEKARAVSEKRLSRSLCGPVRALLEKTAPDVIISFREPTGKILLSDVHTSIPVISMFHNDPEEILAHAPDTEKAALLKSAAIQVLLPSFIPRARAYLDYDRFTAIPNAVRQSPVMTDPGQEREIHRITCVGRLTGSTKRQHILIGAFSGLVRDFPGWQTDLWGAGDDRAYAAALKAMTARDGLGEKVHLRGVTSDMAEVWKETDIFAFPSHHEGFPLALTEAMSAGIPAVGFRSCPAVNELIRHGENGLLCEDGEEAFREALRTLMEDPEKRRTMGKQARKDMEAYKPVRIWEQWISLIKQVVSENRAKEEQK